MKLLIISLCLITLGIQAHDVPTLPELLKKNYQASKPLTETHSYITRTVNFVPKSPPFYIDKIYKSGGKIKISTRLQDGTTTAILAFNGKTAWSQDINGQTNILDKSEAQKLRFIAAASNPNGKLSDYFEKIDLAEKTEIVGSDVCFKLNCITFSQYNQMPTTYYISTKDFLIRRTYMISLQQGSALSINSFYLNYKNFNGLILPEETRTDTPQSPVVSRIISVQINPELRDQEFDPPTQANLTSGKNFIQEP
ncbi:MAG: hypothetical protein PHE87_03075 [Victivallaceae bacterium]|nr:hypothetical protein [Victivallaceae bacterium]